ncbi:MAG: hypothetical protein Q8O38_05145 [Sulfurimicrobium sp.]|nr:hypothetical protein [Sulfurimicrobium sp.]
MKYSVSAWKVLLGALLLLPLLSIAAEPVAMVTDVKGGARLLEKDRSATLSVLSYLAPGMEIELDAGAQVVVAYFAQSTEFSFKGPARIAIQAENAKALKGTVETRRLDNEKSGAVKKFVQSGRLTLATVEMRSLPTVKPRLQSPVNSKIADARPTFSWKALDDVTKYHLLLSDERGQILHDVLVETNSWQLPQGGTLVHGITYKWKVAAVMKSGESDAAESNFTVADMETIKRIEAKRPAGNDVFSDRVLYAVFLENEGFREAARGVWQELAKERPDDYNLKRRAR